EAARTAFSRVKTVEAAREALEDPGALPDLWPTAVEAGWTGLVIDEERGGAGLGPFEAMLVMQECGRVLAGVPLLGHVLATYVLDRSGYDGIEPLATGDKRAAYMAARPPSDLEHEWTGGADGRRLGNPERRRLVGARRPRSRRARGRRDARRRAGGGRRRERRHGRGGAPLRRDPHARPRLARRRDRHGARGRRGRPA